MRSGSKRKQINKVVEAETEVWSRVTGYLRPVSNYNSGKREEYFNRRKFVIKDKVS